MKLSRLLLIIFASAVIEAVFSFRIVFVRLEIILLTLVFLSVKAESEHALFLGCLSGLLKDIISISLIGKHILIFGLIAFGLSRVRKMFYEIPDFIPVVAAGISLLFYSIVFFLTRIFNPNPGLSFKVLLYTFLVIAINTLFSSLLFKLIRRCV